MEAILEYIGNTFGPWLFDKIETFLRWFFFALTLIGIWVFRLYLLIPFRMIWNAFFRFIDRSAMYLVVR